MAKSRGSSGNSTNTPIRLIDLNVDQLTEIVTQIFVSNLGNGKPLEQKTSQPEEVLNVEQVAKLLGLKTSTIYSKVSKRELPHYKKSKVIYFLRTEMIAYIKEGKVKTDSELEKEVNERLASSNRRRRK